METYYPEAPPMTAVPAHAFVARAVATGNLRFAALIAIGFHGLLRTGELLALSFKDMEISSSCGVVSLDHSKAGWRTGSKEAIALRDRFDPTVAGCAIVRAITSG